MANNVTKADSNKAMDGSKATVSCFGAVDSRTVTVEETDGGYCGQEYSL